MAGKLYSCFSEIHNSVSLGGRHYRDKQAEKRRGDIFRRAAHCAFSCSDSALPGKQYYRLALVNNLFRDLYLSSIIVIFAYHLLESALLVYIACILKNRYLKILPFVVSVAFQILFERLGLLVIRDQWRLIYTLLIYQAFIGAFLLVEKYTLKPAS